MCGKQEVTATYIRKSNLKLFINTILVKFKIENNKKKEKKKMSVKKRDKKNIYRTTNKH